MKFILFTPILFWCYSLQAQNLVPNGSFEEYDKCPNNSSQLSFAKGWTININSADYFNNCANFSTGVSVPSNDLGFQYAVTGSAYAGFFAFVQINPGAEEYLGASLKTPLAIGKKYYVSFSVSLADANPSLVCGVDKVGLLFSNKFYGDNIIIPAPLQNNIAHVYSLDIITDTAKWIRIQGTFIADSAYNYFYIGHFFDEQHTDFQCFDIHNTTNRWSYYYVDDVCISLDSIECDINVKADKVPEIKKVFVYPNPANENLYLNSDLKYDCSILNQFMQEIANYKITGNMPIDVSLIPNGVYFLKIKYLNHIFFIKQIIVH